MGADTNLTTSSAIRQAELLKTSNSNNSTLSEKDIEANQKDNLCANIYAHFEDFKVHAKPESLKLKSCRVSKSLLIKEN